MARAIEWPERKTGEDAGMKDLAGKTAFVTGAASGIGLGVATAWPRPA